MSLKGLWNACGRAGRRLKQRNVVLTISPAGIRDKRVMDEFVPWRAVLAVRRVKSLHTTYGVSGGMAGHIPISVLIPDSRGRALVEIDFDASYLSRGGDWTLCRVLTLKIQEVTAVDSDTIYKLYKFYHARAMSEQQLNRR